MFRSELGYCHSNMEFANVCLCNGEAMITEPRRMIGYIDIAERQRVRRGHASSRTLADKSDDDEEAGQAFRSRECDVAIVCNGDVQFFTRSSS